ncbi:MAG: succinate dehydrogenase/fumarate reductase iron-sulfur subunit [Pirellulales bacterium]|nr:succinate dehydrogenase/fumarate reductase iron-sulfur subunit [Pirellulales bacterium]
MNLTLHIWRQKNSDAPGKMVRYKLADVSPDMSFLEMLDVLNEQLLSKGEDPIAFDHDCREGICGMCSLVINGQPHGPRRATTTCQLHMREFRNNAEIYIEPFRAGSFPIIRDLVVDRTSFDRVIQAGGFIAANTGSAPDANALPVSQANAETAMDAAACIGCGACVAACKNASAMLFVAAKVSHMGNLPQGQPGRQDRVLGMVEAMDKEGFGNCTNYFECEAACPKEISVKFIAQMNRDYIKASLSKPSYV